MTSEECEHQNITSIDLFYNNKHSQNQCWDFPQNYKKQNVDEIIKVINENAFIIFFIQDNPSYLSNKIVLKGSPSAFLKVNFQ